MPLKYQIEKESDVPVDHKALYHQREVELPDGRKVQMWILDVEDVVPRARFVEFRDTNITLKKEKDALMAKLEGIDDPERARALLTVARGVELDDAEKFLKKGGVDAMIAERTKNMKEDFDKKFSAEKSRADAATAALDREKIENAVLGACAKLPLQQGAEVMILKQAEMFWTRKDGNIVALDKNGTPRSSKDGTSNLSITEWLQEELLKQHPYLVKDSSGGGASGSGSGGAGGVTSNVNPWNRKAGTWNVTQQMVIEKADPAKAQRMRTAAGVG